MFSLVIGITVMQAYSEESLEQKVSKIKQSAEFIVRPKVIAKNPGAYTFTVDDGPVNALLKCGNFEPFSRRTKVHATGTSPNELILPKHIVSGYNTRKSGWYDGAKIRVYRIVDGELRKIREDVITNHFVEGWNKGCEGVISSKMIKAGVFTAQTFIPSYSRRGCDYFYGVVSVDNQGRESECVTFTKIKVPFNLPKKTSSVKNPIVPFVAYKGSDANLRPAAPTHLSHLLDDKNGLITLNWKMNETKDIAGYRIYYSDYNPNNFRGYHIYLKNSPKDPEKFIKDTDMVFIDHEKFSFDAESELSNRVTHAFQNLIHSPYFKNTEEKKWKLVKHTKNSPKELLLNGGRTCVQVDLLSKTKANFDKYNHASLAQHWYKVLDPKKTYIVEFWAKKEGSESLKATFELKGPLKNELLPFVFDIDKEWKKYKQEWSIKTLLENKGSIGLMRLSFEGQGRFWLDNWKVYEKGINWMDYSESDYQTLRDSKMAAYRSHSHIKTFHGYSMEGFTNSAGGIEWKGGVPNDFNTLPNQLNIMKNAKVEPWLQIEMCMNEKEWLGFIEYFCASYNKSQDSMKTKPWAYKRVLQGHTDSYLSVFKRVLFEISNETWNPLFRPFTFTGVSMIDGKTGRKYNSGEIYGLFQEYVISIFKSSPYWTEEANKKFEFVLGGWAAHESSNGYGQSAGRMSPNSDYMTIAAYNGGWDEKAPPAKPGPKGYFDALTVSQRSHIPRANKLNNVKKSDGGKYFLGTYEAGPGYNLNGLNGVKMTPEMIEQENLTMKSLAAGTATLDVFLAQGSLGYKLQNFFTFKRNRNYWSSHARSEIGGQAYPSWKMLSLYNKHGLGDFLLTQQLSGPSWSVKRTGYKQKGTINIPLVSVYATEVRDRLNLFVLSRKVEGYPLKNDKGFTPVEVNLPIGGAKKLTLYRFSGQQSDHNLDADNVSVEKVELSPELAKESFVINEKTGANMLGIAPASTLLYVFEGFKKSSEAKGIMVKVSSDQPKTVSEGPIRFKLFLAKDIPVEKKDITVSGSSGASSVMSVEEVGGSYGTIYDIVINDMLKSGTVEIEYQGERASVDFQMEKGKSLVLASWFFKEKPYKKGKYVPSDKDLMATSFLPMIEQPRISFGSGYIISDNEYYNDYGLATMTEWNNTRSQDAKDRYVSWTITPKEGMCITLTEIRLGLWSMDKEQALKYRLDYSLDGFSTVHSLDFEETKQIKGCGLSQGQGVPVVVKMSDIEAFKEINNPIEFRLHVWGNGPKGIGKLGEYRGEDSPDLLIKGLLVR